MKTVYWTAEAQTTFNSNIDYLNAQWNDVVVSNFLDRVDVIVAMIQFNPATFPLISRQQNIRRCVVTKHITLYFREVSEDRIDLLTFWNTSQNPEQLKL